MRVYVCVCVCMWVEEGNEIKSKGDIKNKNMIVFLWDKNKRMRQTGEGLLVPSRLLTHLSPTHTDFSAGY